MYQRITVNQLDWCWNWTETFRFQARWCYVY